MKAIILAAGNGRRLYPYTKNIPKCLLDLGGQTILENQLNCIKDCGINDVVLVLGYKSEKIENFLKNNYISGMKIKTLYNPFYKSTNSLLSMWEAREELNQDVIIMNSDDVFEFAVLENILNVADQNICLPIKIKKKYEQEDMKVKINGNKITNIGKELNNFISGESLGLRLFRKRGVSLLKRAIEEEVRTKDAKKKWYVSAIVRLIELGNEVNYLNIKNLFWMDVDSPKDIYKARFCSNKYIVEHSKDTFL